MLWYAKLWPHRVRDIVLGDLLYQCSDTMSCKQQQDEVFGFISFTSPDPQFILQDSTPTTVARGVDPVDCHNRLKVSGTFNCLGSRIQLSESVDFDYLEIWLQIIGINNFLLF